MNKPWSIALRNLARNKKRNIATGIAIGLGFAAFLALGGYINRAETYLRMYTIYALRTGHVVIYKKDGLERYSIKPKNFSLTPDDLTKIDASLANIPGVEIYGPQLTGTGLIGNGCKSVPFYATGMDPNLDKRLRRHPEMKGWTEQLNEYASGRELSEYPPELSAIALSRGLARILHKTKVHDEFGPEHKAVLITDCLAPDAAELMGADANVQLAAGSWSGMMSALDGEVVATYDPGITELTNAGVLMSYEHLQKLYDTENATFVSVWLKDYRSTASVASQLRSDLTKSGLNVDIYEWHEEAVSPMYSGTVQFLYTMVGFVTVVLATVIIFSIFNAATMTVIERSQEIGMMRSLGFTRGEIRRLFVREMLALASIAVVFGGIVGTIGIFTVNNAGILLRPPGVAGGMVLKLIPNTFLATASVLLVFGLAVFTTLAAIRTVAKQKISVLLMGTHR